MTSKKNGQGFFDGGLPDAVVEIAAFNDLADVVIRYASRRTFYFGAVDENLWAGFIHSYLSKGADRYDVLFIVDAPDNKQPLPSTTRECVRLFYHSLQPANDRLPVLPPKSIHINPAFFESGSKTVRR